MKHARLAALALFSCLAPKAVAAAQCEVQRLDAIGKYVAHDGRRIAVASLARIRVYEQDGRTAFHEQELLFPEYDGGTYIHSLALDGDTLAFGVYAPSPVPRSVRVFERSGGVWGEVASLAPTDSQVDFGQSVALAGDLLAIGAPRDMSGTIRTGAVHLYERLAGVWSPRGRLVPAGGSSGERFGWSVDLDRERLAVGAPLFFSSAQKAYVFERTAAGWQQSAVTPALSVTALFGAALALRGDTLLVGDPSATGGDRAWIFEHDGGGWAETAELADFALGDAVALSGDGQLALIADPNSGDTVPGSGLVHVFERQASGWQRVEPLLPTRPAVHGHFGTGLACAGELAVVAESASVTTVSLRESLCRTLLAQPATLSLTSGGRQTLRLNPGREHAGRRFLLMGSASGDSPGFRLGAARIPLVPDAYLASSLPGRRRPPFVNNFGLLGANAPQAEVTIDVPPGTDLALAGHVLHHAFVVLERGVVHVSNTRTLTLVP